MNDAFVNVNNIPVRVVTLGRWISEEPKEEQETIILIIPGNPGITSFYLKFMKRLYEERKCPVWLIGHSGHEKPRSGSNEFMDEPYLLEDQIKFKEKFIEQYVPQDAKLILLAHSIGSYMTLELLKNQAIASRVFDSCLLFPTIENMSVTPNGKFFTFYATYFLPLIFFFVRVFNFLPIFIRMAILTLYFKIKSIPLCYRNTVLGMIDVQVLNQIFTLAKDEMKVVKTRNNPIITKYVHDLKLLYGETDGWVPVSYFDKLKEQFPDIKARMCSYQHTFVFHESEEVAELISNWIRQSKL